ncbi:MAG: hypothetical protein OEM62_10550, partial [Acidobacteriota bacterium]|nr:hypothetical protein [Acidobacteriota bacterium]
TYLRFYAEDFVPADGASREAWEAQRTERLTRPGRILVALTSMETEIIERGEARVTFTQTYRSDSFSDIVRKTLDLRHTPQGWKIHREQATAS